MKSGKQNVVLWSDLVKFTLEDLNGLGLIKMPMIVNVWAMKIYDLQSSKVWKREQHHFIYHYPFYLPLFFDG